MKMKTIAFAIFVGCTVAGCSGAGAGPADAGVTFDSSTPIADGAPDTGPGDPDARLPDAALPDGAPDAHVVDAALPDVAVPPPDARLPDAAMPHPDAALPDAGDGTTHAIVFTGANATAQFGNLTGGSLFDDACPAGQALVGFGGSLTAATGFHRQMNAQCGVVQRTGVAGSFAIHVSAGNTLPVRGVLNGASPWSRLCGTDQIVSGFVGRSGALIDQLTFSCVPLVVDANDGTTITLGAVSLLPSIGGSGGNAFAQSDCPAGQVASVARLRAGDGIDAFGIACSVPSVAP